MGFLRFGFGRIDELLVHDDRVLALPCRVWLDASCISSIRHAISFVSDSGLVALRGVEQKVVSSHLAACDSIFDLDSFIARRIARFVLPDDQIVTDVINAMRELGKKLKPCILSAYITMVLNDWVTESRFGKPSTLCPLL